MKEKIIITILLTLAVWWWLAWFTCQNEYIRQCEANFEQCQEDFYKNKQCYYSDRSTWAVYVVVKKLNKKIGLKT